MTRKVMGYTPELNFEHTFELSEKWGHNDVTQRVFGGKKFVLLNDALTKKSADYYVRQLRKINCFTRVVHTVEGYRVYYRRK